jgi:hypothetical protein
MDELLLIDLLNAVTYACTFATFAFSALTYLELCAIERLISDRLVRVPK